MVEVSVGDKTLCFQSKDGIGVCPPQWCRTICALLNIFILFQRKMKVDIGIPCSISQSVHPSLPSTCIDGEEPCRKTDKSYLLWKKHEIWHKCTVFYAEKYWIWGRAKKKSKWPPFSNMAATSHVKSLKIYICFSVCINAGNIAQSYDLSKIKA